MNSIWVKIPDYPNYMVSPEGNILSLNYGNTGKAKTLKQGRSNRYPNVSLNGRTFTVHRIVAAVFCKKSLGKEFVNHIDGDRENNNFENLEWCTLSHNQTHSYRVLGNKAARGEKHGKTKLKEKEVLEIYKMAHNNIDYGLIAEKFNIQKPTITNIKKGQVWGHITREVQIVT